jgi:hypothetical protein
MSYYAHYYADGYQFYLAATVFPAAIAAVRKAVLEAEDEYEWPFHLQNEATQLAEDAGPRVVIERIFALCVWKVTFNDAGDIREIQLPRSWEGAAEGEFDIEQARALFFTIAPYVREGSLVYLFINTPAAAACRFQDGKCVTTWFRDYIESSDIRIAPSLLERVRAYLVASDVNGGDTGARLAAELEHAPDHWKG